MRSKARNLNKMARKFNVPKATLKRKVDDRNKIARGRKKKFGRYTNLPPEIEEEIIDHILTLEKNLFGITRKDLQKLAYNIAESYGIVHKFKNGKAGKKWYYCFMSRHRELSLRQSEATSAAQALGFNKEKVMGFLTALLDFTMNLIIALVHLKYIMSIKLVYLHFRHLKK